jgi:hypothetical protein
MPTLKCKKCGHKTRNINAMRIHYFKKHPQAMKRHKVRRVSVSARMTGAQPSVSLLQKIARDLDILVREVRERI